MRGELVGSPQNYILFDDTVFNKRHSQRIELVRRLCSGNAHTVIKVIGLVNCVYVNSDTTLETDGKSKLDHVANMLVER